MRDLGTKEILRENHAETTSRLKVSCHSLGHVNFLLPDRECWGITSSLLPFQFSNSPYFLHLKGCEKQITFLILLFPIVSAVNIFLVFLGKSQAYSKTEKYNHFVVGKHMLPVYILRIYSVYASV